METYYSEDGKTLLSFRGLESTFVIPDSVTSIGENAFARCKRLEECHVHWKELKDLDIHENAFGEMNNVVLFVPEGTVEVYRSHPLFSQFKEVVGE